MNEMMTGSGAAPRPMRDTGRLEQAVRQITCLSELSGKVAEEVHIKLAAVTPGPETGTNERAPLAGEAPEPAGDTTTALRAAAVAIEESLGRIQRLLIRCDL